MRYMSKSIVPLCCSCKLCDVIWTNVSIFIVVLRKSLSFRNGVNESIEQVFYSFLLVLEISPFDTCVIQTLSTFFR